MTAIQKLDISEERVRRFIAADWRCVRCGERPEDKGDTIQLAHRIRKGLADKYGPEVVHHALSAVPSCSTCNQLLLVHDMEEAELVYRIKRVLAGEETISYREEYERLRDEFSQQRT